jgi:hypothetical protein
VACALVSGWSHTGRSFWRNNPDWTSSRDAYMWYAVSRAERADFV